MGRFLACPITERSETIVGFETGSFCLYVERGKEHGPVFDFLVPDIQKRQAATRSGRLHRDRGESKDTALLHQRPIRYGIQCRAIFR